METVNQCLSVEGDVCSVLYLLPLAHCSMVYSDVQVTTRAVCCRTHARSHILETTLPCCGDEGSGHVI